MDTDIKEAKRGPFGGLLRGDGTIWFIVILLTLASGAVVASATGNLGFIVEGKGKGFFSPMFKHFGSILLAWVVCVVCTYIKPSLFGKIAFWGLVMAIGLLIWALIGGVDYNDGKRWVKIFGFSFQVSELARLALINYIAVKLGGEDYSSRTTFFIMLISSGLIIGLIFVENISTAVILGAIVYIMWLVGDANRKLLIRTTIALGIGIAITLSALLLLPKDTFVGIGRMATAKSRIETFFKSDEGKGIEALDADGKDFQQIQSKKAMARGGITGVGSGNSEARFILPEPYSDFVFAILVEEYGLILGAFGIIFIYSVLIFRIVFIAQRTRSMYLKMMLLGIGMAISAQALINMAVATGTIPVTGQNLPFISRGGSSYLFTSIYFGVLLSVSYAAKQDVVSVAASNKEGSEGAEVELQSIPEVDRDLYEHEEERK